MNDKIPDELFDVALYAWIGEDELGSGEIGLRQALTPCGLIPLVSVKEGKLDQEYIRKQLEHQARKYGKPIRLVRVLETLAGVERKRMEELAEPGWRILDCSVFLQADDQVRWGGEWIAVSRGGGVSSDVPEVYYRRRVGR